MKNKLSLCIIRNIIASLLFLWILLAHSMAAGPVEILYIKILENNQVLIRIEENDADIESVNWTENLDIDSSIFYSIDDYQITNDSIIFNNPNPDKQIYYQIISETVRSHIHAPIFINEIVYIPDDCFVEIPIEWHNYSITHWNFQNINVPPAPLPLPFDSIYVYIAKKRHGIACDFREARLVYKGLQSNHYETVSEVSHIIEEQGIYCIKIRSFKSIEPGFETVSNIRNTDELFPVDLPDSISINRVSFAAESNQLIHVDFYADESDSSGGFDYELWRSGNDVDYTYRDKKMLNDSFSDPVPDQHDGPWYYFLSVNKEECGWEFIKQSDTISSIFLEASYSDDILHGKLSIDLDWQHPKPPPGSLDYRLYSKLPGPDREAVEDDYNLHNNSQPFEIDVDEDDFGGELLLWIKTEIGGNKVRSNSVRIKIDILERLPNAFRPSSDIHENQKFLPVFRIAPEGYKFSVYNREGIRVFYTEDDTESWDGTINGADAPDGAYIYEIRYDQADKPVRGVVYLVK